jgi:15-cis-phytoene synthase
MTVLQLHPWERRLLSAATEALDAPISKPKIHTEPSALDHAYLECEQITRQHSKTFYVASGLLPYEKRRATRALYAFCRITDDIVDRAVSQDERQTVLQNWRDDVMAEHPTSNDAVVLAWADARARFDIPTTYAQQLIEGCGRDLYQARYDTFGDLAEYAYSVASTVGLMAMHIVGFVGVEAVPYAVRLGVALQITNILRDVGEDWRNGRLYLPQEELNQFKVKESDIANGIVTPEWREFMRYQIRRNRELYAESIDGISLLHPNGRFAIAAAAKLYEAILLDIEAHDYDVFNRRASISTLGKVKRLPAIWWFSRQPIKQGMLE